MKLCVPELLVEELDACGVLVGCGELVACAERFGLSRTTMADVAKEARLARQTVYRYFPSRHDLLAALVLREEERLVARVKQAIAPHSELRPALEAAFTSMHDPGWAIAPKL